jgi:hypothetical protein
VCVGLGVSAGIAYGLPERLLEHFRTLQRLYTLGRYRWSEDGMTDFMRARETGSSRVYDERMNQCEKAVAQAKKMECAPRRGLPLLKCARSSRFCRLRDFESWL